MRSNLMRPIMLLMMLFMLVSFSERMSYKEEASPDFVTKVYSRFLSYLNEYREEKLYIHTDKPYYSAGENIWLKGYVVNAATMYPESLSGFIYVELFNREDSVVSRVKIARDSTGFSGHVALDQTLPAGDYNLRGYTQWMRNNSDDFFFQKKIYVGNKIEDAVNCDVAYGELEDDEVLITIRFTDEHKRALSDEKVEVSGRWSGARRRKAGFKTDADGQIEFPLPVDTVKNLPDVLDVALYLENYTFETKLFVPHFGEDFDIQFFPESGVLLNDGLQYVAFKAIGTDGMSREVTGSVYKKNGEEVAEIKSAHNGMGKFMLYTEPNETYYAKVKTTRGVEKHIELPATETEGLSLRLNFFRDKINYSIINKLPNQTTPLYLLIHSNGKPFVVAPFKNLIGQVSESNLDPGVHSFSIIDSLGNVYCERLFFIYPQSLPTIAMQPDKEVYKKRDAVNLKFNIATSNGKPAEGFYSISVTDNQFVKSDSINDNLLTYLLLSSDIKGYIERPHSYFEDEDPAHNHEKMDLLMLTQGWRRYNTSKLLKEELEYGDYYMEAGQTISGKVVNFFGKPVKDRDVYGLVSGQIISTKTDSVGRYIFDGIGFQDSVSFVLRAQRKKGLVDVEIIPDLETFPSAKTHFIPQDRKQKVIQEEYFDQSKLKFFSEGGMRHIYLDEVTVRAKKKREGTGGGMFAGMADSEVTSDQLDKMRGRDMLTILSTIAGVNVMGDKITIRNNPGSPLILMDGIPWSGEAEDIRFLTTDDVDNIQVFKGAAAAIFGPGSSNGVISITTKRGEIYAPKVPISMATVAPLGCQKPEKFYVPKYEVKEVKENPNPDLRTTLYWNPSLSSDSNGVVNVQFYTADPATTYNILLEGITKEGELCRYEGTIERN